MTDSAPPAFDFSALVDRRGMASKKWAAAEQADLIPMWVADMDLPAPPAVQAALRTMAEHGMLGYGEVTEDLVLAFLRWCDRHYGWTPERDWLVWIPGVVPGMNVAIEAWLGHHEGLATHTPVYPPICQMGTIRGRPMQWLDTLGEQIDYAGPADTLAQALNPDTRALILCNPQNPTGHVYTREELEAIHQVAAERDLLVISDEIWSDLRLDDQHRHIPYVSLNQDAAQRSVTLLAPSKTFNIAGLCCAVAVIPNPQLRQQFRQQARGLLPDISYAGLIAAQAAWAEGDAWLAALRAHLNRNFDRLEVWLQEFPQLGYQRPQSTFLAWLDMRAWPQAETLAERFATAGVMVSDGAPFAAPGFVRLNLGCPEAQLEQALQRMGTVLEKD
ncbi:MAG: PatB family C-S lyase [Natronospirillum sp.]|uniref:MalY/PatB family protein n=1 Tax=Natronospirillum sp. TaxID=2812955 RepID=UPI0025DE9287|nr:PatB family C-S lyase [Natronospirillum sp.]MCH8550303.1 PatB family C-S lyase [Natronospirillum sp.]